MSKDQQSVLFASFDVVPAPKGASRHILQSTAAIQRSIGPVTLLCAGAPGLAETETLEDGMQVMRAPLPAGQNFIHRIEAYAEYIRQHLARAGSSYRTVHFRDIWSGLPLLDWYDDQAKKGFRPVRLLFEVNGLPSFELGYHYPALKENKGFLRKLRAQELACMVAADHILTVSPVTKQYIVGGGILPHRISVVPNGVDPELFDVSKSPVAHAVPQLLYVGTLAPWQGVATLLRALKQVLRHRPVRCVFVGRGRKVWLKNALALAAELKVLDAVDFRGSVSPAEVPGLIASANLCLAPLERTRRNTRQGCCPIKLLEYMACRRPFIASDLAVVRALLPPRTEIDCEPFLVLPGKPGHLANRIAALLDDEARAQKLADELGSYARKELTWDKTNAAVVAIHQNLTEAVRTDHGEGEVACALPS